MNSATEHRTCPNCGAVIPTKAPQGLCPKCLMAAAAVTTDAGRTGGKRPEPPSLERLAAAFPQLEVLEFIGQGGMGAVYKARQRQLDRIVALKVLPPGIGGDPAFAERFTREAKALAKLMHPNIVALFEFGQAEGIYYLLMEYVDGVSLGQLLRSSRVSPREALAIVPQICDALQYAHDQGIVHRDIKPENILLDRRGRVKVADFGLAKLMECDRLDHNNVEKPSSMEEAAPSTTCHVGAPGTGTLQELTSAGKIMGTPAYMAPEQAEHPADVDHRADIYALGVVFYQMLTGELPAKCLEPPSKKVQIDVRLDEVVMRALAKKPELRYQQVSEVKTLVQTIIGTPDPSTGGSEGADPNPGGRTAEAERQSEIRVTPAASGSSRRPWSLMVVAGLFMLTGCSAAWDIGSGLHKHIYSFNFGLLGLSVGIGLLRLRHGWRVAALIMIWLPFIFGACLGIVALFGQFTIVSYARFFGYELTGLSRFVAAIVACTLLPILLVWMSRVLTHSDVKALFQRASPNRSWIEWSALPVAIALGFALSSLAGPSDSAQSSRAKPLAGISSKVVFGPVVERVVMAFDENPAQACLDLASGEFRAPPATIAERIRVIANKVDGELFTNLNVPGDERYDWLKTSGVDLIGNRGPDGSSRFKYIGQPPSYYHGGWSTFDTVSPSEVIQALQSSPFFAGDKPNLPAAYINAMNPDDEASKKASYIIFRTHDGDVGVMKILGTNEDPHGVRIRYKLAQNSVTTVTPVSLPVLQASPAADR